MARCHPSILYFPLFVFCIVSPLVFASSYILLHLISYVLSPMLVLLSLRAVPFLANGLLFWRANNVQLNNNELNLYVIIIVIFLLT